MIYPNEFSNLVESFEMLPGVGKKTAERFVYSIYENELDVVKSFADNLIKFKNNIRKCEICGLLTNSKVCPICQTRNNFSNLLCVVQDSKSVFKFEETHKFNGLYHVLGNLLSPINGIVPEDLNISNLIERITKYNIEEVILALPPTIEGETTSLYIKKRLECLPIKISRLSYGIPIGTDINYLDSLTLLKALDDRKLIS